MSDPQPVLESMTRVRVGGTGFLRRDAFVVRMWADPEHPDHWMLTPHALEMVAAQELKPMSDVAPRERLLAQRLLKAYKAAHAVEVTRLGQGFVLYRSWP